MKILFILVLVIAVLLLGYRFLSLRPQLIAIGGSDEKIEFWTTLPAEEEKQILEAYQAVKAELPETLKKRTAARNWGSTEMSAAKIYFVKKGLFLLIFADSYPFKAPVLEVIGVADQNSIHYNLRTKKFNLL